MRYVWSVPIFIALCLCGHYALDRLREASDRAPTPSARKARGGGSGGGRRIEPVTLSGPSGNEVTLPPKDGPAVVNVWLQACADCMPRFRASQQLEVEGREWPQPVINVAYGRATQDWADEYGVGKNLVVDAGSHVVMPLGISTFTTLVVDQHGVVRHTDYADREGFLERVQVAMQEARTPEGQKPVAPARPASTKRARGQHAHVKGPFEDARVLGALALLVLGLLLKLGSALPAAGGGASRDEGVWREELVASGKRCHHCGGRFDDPQDAARCTSCKTPFHEVCLGKAEVCTNMACGRYMKPL